LGERFCRSVVRREKKTKREKNCLKAGHYNGKRAAA